MAMNPEALLIPAKYKQTADPESLGRDPETQPDESEAYDRAWQEVLAE